MTPPLFRYEEVGGNENGEMAGKRALTEARGVHELAGRKAPRLVTHQQPKGIQAGRMREGSKGIKGNSRGHPSAIIDGMKRRHLYRK